MKATEAKLLSFLQKSPQFIIPIYQRTYSWSDKQCRQIWDDILRAGSSDTIAVHFIGSIVYVEQGLSQITHQAPLLVIDGQQRLTVNQQRPPIAETTPHARPRRTWSRTLRTSATHVACGRCPAFSLTSTARFDAVAVKD
jgi:hypothetical protein